MRPARLLTTATLAALLGAGIASSAWADDIEVYSNLAPNPTKPPLTVLTLDLNVTPSAVVCSNVLTTAACSDIRTLLTLTQLDSLLGLNLTTLNNGPPFKIGPIRVLDLTTLYNVKLSALSSTAVTLLTSALGTALELTQAEALRPLLRELIKSITDARLAVMVSHGNRGPVVGGVQQACTFASTRASTTACSNGGYVLVGFLDLLNDPLQANLNTILSRVDNLMAQGAGSANHPFQGKELYLELLRYLDGGAIYNGHLGYFDYGNADATTNLNEFNGVLSWDTSIENGANYDSALDKFGTCDTVNVVNIMFTDSASDSDSDSALAATLPGVDVDGDGNISFAETVTRTRTDGFSHKGTVVKFNSYFAINGPGTDATLLGNLGNTVSVLPSVLNLFGLGATVAEFIEPTLIVDANLLTPSFVRGRTSSGLLDRAYFPLFQPAENNNPAWSGNVKKLAIDNSTNPPVYRDANGDSAIALDGRIRDSALTYWTHSNAIGGAGSDGRETTLGGTGQNIPGYQFGGGGTPGRNNSDGQRKIYYDTAAGALAGFDADNAATVLSLLSDLGVATSSEAKELMLYGRGYDVGTTASSKGSGNDVRSRAWMQGAVLHSQPVAINYGARSSYTASNPDVRIVYGSADGLIHMVKDTEPGGAESGVEAWAMMPRAVMSRLKTLRDGTPTSNLPYGVDGAPAVYKRDRAEADGTVGVIDSSNAEDKVWLFYGLRRGGKGYYALNVTDPDSPSLMWKIDNSTVGYTDLGLTFSSPVVAQLTAPAYTGDLATPTTRPVLLFGGGYNGGWSGSTRIGKDLARGSDNKVGTDESVGAGFFIVNAETGARIWRAAYGASAGYNAVSGVYSHPLMTDSFAADPAVLDTDGDGLADRAYIGDTGGRLWRADFQGTDPSKWTMTPLFSIGRHDGAGVANDRRFFHRVDVVPAVDDTGPYDAVLIASGDRADPYNYTTVNRLYAYRDRDVGAGSTASVISSESNLPSDSDFADVLACTGACAESTLLPTGWKLTLSSSGEKGLASPLTINGKVFVTTYVPPDNTVDSCAPREGTSRIYSVTLDDASAAYPLFALDSNDSDDRSMRTSAPGFPGNTVALSTNTLVAGNTALEVEGRYYLRGFWRERRQDDERPIPQE